MVKVYPDLDSLSRAAARFIVATGKSCLESKERFELVLSGGRTPETIYDILAEDYAGDDDLWERTHVFWGDERYVTPDSPESNFGMAKAIFLDRVGIPVGQIHPIPTGEPEPRKAAELYEKIFPARPDLLLLGMGTDGHTASLFPDSPALAESGRRFVAVEAPVAPKQRLTLTPPVIGTARQVLVIVSGTDKAGALAKVFAVEGDPCRTPARLVRDALWYLDHQAAGQLDEMEKEYVTISGQGERI